MTQAPIRQTPPRSPRQMVTVQLTAMQLPDANPLPQENRWGLGTEDEERICRLRLSPGEPSELMVQIRNVSDRPLNISLVVTGNFPAPWHRVILPDPILLNRHKKDATVCFTLDPNFFEDRLALRPGDTHLLDYSGHVNIYATPHSPDSSSPHPSSPSSPPSQLLSSTEFTLHIRPHTKYPTYLPAVYREIDFMNRFLAIFEQAFDPAVQTLSTLWAYLDPLTTSEAMLPFLAQWVGCPSDMAWSFSQRRLIRYALSIYRWRGTRWGMLLFLHLYTGLPLCEADILPEEAHLIDSRNYESADQPEPLRHIRVDEDSIEGFVVGNTLIGSDAMLGGGRPYHFTVRLRSPTRLNEAQVRQLINQEKPAFSSYTLHIVYYDRTASDV